MTNAIDYDDGIIEATDFLCALNEDISDDNTIRNVSFVKRKSVFLILPDPFESDNSYQTFRFGQRCMIHSANRGESPLPCYAFKLALFGFQNLRIQTSPFSKQQLFDMSVSMMLRSNHVVVYTNGTYTETMENLLSVAKQYVSRIDIRQMR